MISSAKAIGWARLAAAHLSEFFATHHDEYNAASELEFLRPDKVIRTGMMIVVGFVIVFFGWSTFAPLDSAVVMPGILVVESHRKPVQHLEGGSVRRVLVQEGDVVAQGQTLIELDGTEARASRDLIRGEADALAAEEARLEAERDEADYISFPPDLLARRDDPKVAQAIRGEENTFKARRDALAQQSAIIDQRIKENQKLNAGLQKQLKAVDDQSGFIANEAEAEGSLYAKKLTTLQRFSQVKRAAADLTGQHGQLVEKMAQVELNSGENKLQFVDLKSQFLSDVAKDLREVQTKRFDALDRLQAAEHIVSRLELTAPTAGKVVELSVHAQGAVIRPGEMVMEIVPVDDQLEVEAHMRPEDADEVHPDMKAKVNLSASKQRRMPIILGSVRTVSADRIVDPRTGQGYFAVSVTVDRRQLKDYAKEKLIPGMPVDVAIETGKRTALDYFIEPITSVFDRGMREK